MCLVFYFTVNRLSCEADRGDDSTVQVTTKYQLHRREICGRGLCETIVGTTREKEEGTVPEVKPTTVPALEYKKKNYSSQACKDTASLLQILSLPQAAAGKSPVWNSAGWGGGSLVSMATATNLTATEK